MIHCIVMRLSEKESLEYLSNRGFDISQRYFYKIKKQIQESVTERLHLIASKEFLSQHVERIETLKSINNEMWTNYRKEKDPSKRVQILKQIAELQLYLSSYYDSTRYVVEQGVKITQQEAKSQISDFSQQAKKKKKKIENQTT